MIKDSFMALSLTQSLAERAIDSIRNGGRREVRNTLELFRSFFTMLDFEYVPFYRARYIQSFKVTPEALIKKIINSVDKEIAKTFIVNMIYSVIYEGRSLHKLNQGRWMESLTNSANLEEDISNYNKNGIYAFSVNTDIKCDRELFRAINNHKRCVFFLYSDKYSKKLLNFNIKCENICYILSILAYNNIGTVFNKQGILYGLTKNAQESFSLDDEILELQRLDSEGAMFISYYNKDLKIDNQLYNEIFKIRKSLNIKMALINLNGLYKRVGKRLMEE